MGFPRIALALNQLPTDVTLKLSDGNINTHKMMLAAASIVFKEKLYEEESNSNEVDLPNESYKTIKQLIDGICKGSCELDSLDDAIPLMKVVDCYKINKAPFLQMFGEAILSQLDSSNYFTLLPKYVSVMSEESHKKAANEVMSYTNNDFVTKFDETKDLPEKVLLCLLKRNEIICHDIDIFSFLVKWCNYQTRELGICLQLTPELFKCVRYSLIIPQLLSSMVAPCDLVDARDLNKAYRYLYSSCSPIGEIDESLQLTFAQNFRKPHWSLMPEWHAQQGVNLSHNAKEMGLVQVSFAHNKLKNYCIVKSAPLKNGIYSFYIFNPPSLYQKSEPIYASVVFKNEGTLKLNENIVCTDKLQSYDLVTFYIHDNYLFLKRIGRGKVISTISTEGSGVFTVCIQSDHINSLLAFENCNKLVTFKIGDHLQ